MPRKIYTVGDITGSNWFRGVPLGKYWLIEGLRFVYATDATPGIRGVRLRYSDNLGNIFWLSGRAGDQDPSITCSYSGAIVTNQSVAPVVTTTQRNIVIPKVILQPLWNIRADIDAIQAGDVLSEIVFYVDEQEKQEDIMYGTALKLGALHA